MNETLPPKKDVAMALLKGTSVFVHLDPRVDGVVVPKWFKKQPQLVLQIGWNMPVPIPDLALDEDGIICTLSFSGSPFFCAMPWNAIYALFSEEGGGMIWPEDVPSELSTKAAKQGPRLVGGKQKKKKPKLVAVSSTDSREEPKDDAPPKPKPKLTAVESPPRAEAADPDADASDDKSSKLPPYLRVIK